VNRTGRVRQLLGGYVGLLAHRATASVRGLIAGRIDADPASIAVVCDWFLRYAPLQAIGLKQAGFDVTLYYIDRLDEFGGSESDRALLLNRARTAGVALVPLPRRRIRSLLSHTLWLHRDLRRRRIAAAVIHSHIDPRYATLGIALPVALIIHDPQMHSGDEASAFPFPVRLISRVSELTSACLIIHSGRLREQIRPLLRRLPIGVVPLGADMAPCPVPVPRERRLLIFGRLFAYKGVDTALEAFSTLPDSMSDVKLVIAGRGPLAALAREKRNVDLREEYVTDADIEALLDESRLVLLPYKDATQSAVGLQAVARGVPCIVSRTGGLPELVEDSLPSLVVPPDDPQRLGEAIAAHIDHDEQLRRAIYEHTARSFAWHEVAHQLHSELMRLGLCGLAVRGAGRVEPLQSV
jgi:glycosyltransferase involved in cell wall biosynthesis